MNPRRRTKIVVSLGPSTDRAKTMSALIEQGIDMARLNMSHGTRDDHRRRAQLVCQHTRDLCRPDIPRNMPVPLFCSDSKIAIFGRNSPGGVIAQEEDVAAIIAPDQECRLADRTFTSSSRAQALLTVSGEASVLSSGWTPPE